MIRIAAILVLLVLAACNPVTCEERDGGIGGTGGCPVLQDPPADTLRPIPNTMD